MKDTLTTGAILAGGLGIRLREVVPDKQKVIASVSNRPFISYVLDTFVEAGIGKIVLCTGYHAEQVCKELGNSYRGADLVYSEEFEPLGTAGALRNGLPHFMTDDIVVANGDTLCRADLRALRTFHESRDARISILLSHIADSQRFGSVEINAAGEVTRFLEKQQRPGPGLVNAGVYCISTSVIHSFDSTRKLSLEREIFPRLIGKGLYGQITEAEFLDIGVPESYASASKAVALI